jgi:TolB-like protein
MQKLVADDIRDQVKRVISSAPLSNSEILSGLLRFIVNETLAGRATNLKEYNIGIHALNRKQNFNPQLDSIVRIHAGRLRSALREYYYEAGVKDPITIQVPKGGYVPTFELRGDAVNVTSTSSESEELGLTLYANQVHHQKLTRINPKLYFSYEDKSSIAVLPFKKNGLGNNLKFFSQSIGEYLSTELTLFKNLKVLSYYSGCHIAREMSDIRSIGTTLEADYLITGCVYGFDDNVACVYVHLNRTATADQLWARTYRRKSNQHHSLFLEEVVENIMASLVGIDGVIARHESSKRAPLSVENRNGRLTQWYSEYRNKFDKPTMIKAKHYFHEVIKTDPDNALALGYLSEILSNEMLLSQSFDPNVMELGLAYALRAINVDARCQQGYQALAISKLRSKNFGECLRALEQGLDINPKCLDYKGTMGALLIYAGQFESGAKILAKAINLNSHLPWWQILSYSHYLYHQKSFKDALVWADRTNKNIVWVPLVKAACYSQLGQVEKGAMILEQMKKQFVFEDLSEDGLKRIFNSDKILKEIMDGLRKLPYIFFFGMSFGFL